MCLKMGKQEMKTQQADPPRTLSVLKAANSPLEKEVR